MVSLPLPPVMVSATSARPVMLTAVVTALASTTSMLLYWSPEAASATLSPAKSEVSFRVSVPVPPSMVSVPVTAPPTVKVSAAEPPVRSRLAPAFRPADTSKVVAPVLPLNFSMPDTDTAVSPILLSVPSAAKVMAAAVPVSSKVSVPSPPSMVRLPPSSTAPTVKVSLSSPPVRVRLPLVRLDTLKVSLPAPPSMLRPPVREPPLMLMRMLSLPSSRAKL